MSNPCRGPQEALKSPMIVLVTPSNILPAISSTPMSDKIASLTLFLVLGAKVADKSFIPLLSVELAFFVNVCSSVLPIKKDLGAPIVAKTLSPSLPCFGGRAISLPLESLPVGLAKRPANLVESSSLTTQPPRADRFSFIAARLPAPILPTLLFLITNSPGVNMAGTVSLLPVPGTTPPRANPMGPP